MQQTPLHGVRELLEQRVERPIGGEMVKSVHLGCVNKPLIRKLGCCAGYAGIKLVTSLLRYWVTELLSDQDNKRYLLTRYVTL